MLLLILACLWNLTSGTVLMCPFGAGKSVARSSTSLQASSSLFQVAKKVFEDKNWHFDLQDHYCDEHDTVITSRLKGQNGSYLLIAFLNDSKQRVRVYIRSSFNVPESRRAKVAEYLTRANYGLFIGNFEMDYSDGEVRYKGSMDLTGGKLEPRMFHTLIDYTTSTMDAYHAGLMDVIYSDKSPSEIIGKVERGELTEHDALFHSSSGGVYPS
jgi:hypothetical protein